MTSEERVVRTFLIHWYWFIFWPSFANDVQSSLGNHFRLCLDLFLHQICVPFVYFCLIDLTCRSLRTCPNCLYCFIGVLSVWWRKEDTKNRKRRWPFTKGQGTVSSWWRGRSSKVKCLFVGSTLMWAIRKFSMWTKGRSTRRAQPSGLSAFLCSSIWFFLQESFIERKRKSFYILIYLNVF